MKKTKLFLAFFCLGFSLIAQESSFRTHRVGFSFGIAEPTGDFGSNDITKAESGFATTGRRIAIQYEYRLDELVSFTLDFGVNAFEVDVNSIARELTGQFPNGFTGTYEIAASGHVISHNLIGGRFRKADKNSALYINPYIGFGRMLVSDLSIVINSFGETTRSETPEVISEPAFLYGFSVGGDIYLSQLIDLRLNLAYLAGNFKAIESEIKITDTNNNVSYSNESYDQAFSAISFSVGLGFNF